MIRIKTALGTANIVQDVSELPAPSTGRIFLDAETNGLHPYKGNRAIGWSFLRDDETEAFYVPIRHSNPKWNLPLEPVLRWLQDVISTCHEWVNHNIKFDAHFAAADGCLFSCRLVCTWVQSVLKDSDKLDHRLKTLVEEWLGISDQKDVDAVDSYLRGLYGRSHKKGLEEHGHEDVPADIEGEYGCGDVFKNRLLWRHLVETLPEGTAMVRENEILLTPVLFDMEREGLKVDMSLLKQMKLQVLHRLIRDQSAIADITGKEFTDSPDWMFDTFVNRFQLPILSWQQERGEGGKWVQGNPSFDGDALKAYSIHPQVTHNPDLVRLVSALQNVRSDAHFLSTYLEGFSYWADVDDRIHGMYKQVVRTGRMSVSDPNTSGLSEEAKLLLIPGTGQEFFACDASQVEFRFIVHYLKDAEAIRAYNEDPNTDFHSWVASICRIKRSQAKNINFAIGFGAGKMKVVSMLVGDPAIMEEIGMLVRGMVESGKIPESEMQKTYKDLCFARASEMYHTYHERLPSLKPLSYAASDNAKRRGWVFNLFGRRRHLPPWAAHKAFNTVIQSSSMDYIKTRIIALAPRYNREMRDLGIRIMANVHDEILFAGPSGVFEHAKAPIMGALEACPVPVRVPLRWAGRVSPDRWRKP